MAQVGIAFYEQILDGDTPMWEKTRSAPETTNQCLAAIVILLAELVDDLKEKNSEFNPRT